MSTEKIQFPPEIPEVGARVRITSTIINLGGTKETYTEEATVTSRYAQSFEGQVGKRYQFSTNGIVFKNGVGYDNGSFFSEITPSSGLTFPVSVEILPTKPAEES